MGFRLHSQTLVALLVVLLSASSVVAQPPGELDAPPPTSEDPELRQGGPWALYDEAFLALGAGRDARATQLLERLLEEYPDHAAATRAREVLETLSAEAAGEFGAPGLLLQPGVPVPPLDATPLPPGSRHRPSEDAVRGERPTGLARAEIAAMQTLHGAAVGAEVCTMLDCDTVRGWTLTMVGGAGAGVGLTIAFTADGIRPGTAAAIDTGLYLGAWNGAALALAADGSTEATVAAALVGQGLGMLGGGFLARRLEPTGGQVSLLGSGAIWTTALYGLVVGAARPDFSLTSAMISFLLASDIGAVAGGYTASRFPMSRGRVLLIDLGTILGVGLGFAADVVIEGSDFNPTPFMVLGAVGLVGGFSLSWWLTRGWDEEEHAEPAVDVAVVPAPGGAMASLSGAF